MNPAESMTGASISNLPGSIVVVLAIAAASVASLVGIQLLRKHESRTRSSAGGNRSESYNAGWEYCVDGRVIARLTWAGAPEDPNHYFVHYDVSISAGCDAEVETLLYRSNHRNPDDARIEYRSLGEGGLILADSQVYVGHEQGNRVALKVYPKANEDRVV